MSGRTSDDIRLEIERKRGEMDQTVDALERKLSPGQLLDHALWMLRGSDTGSEKARAVGSAVGGFAKDHPIPVALMSAGAAWLVAESRHDASDVGPGTYGRAEGRVGPYMGDALDEGPMGDDGGFPAAGYEGDGNGTGVTDRAREKVVDIKDRAVGRMHALGDSARDTAQAAREQSAELAGRTRQRYASTLEENPLAIGAAAFGLGLAAGLSAPSTRWESEHMGATSDALKGEARSMAGETARAARHAGADALSVVRREAFPEGIVDEVKGRAKRIASEAMTAAKETARAEGLGVDELRDRAKRVASDAMSAAKDTARSEGLSAEGLKERAREAGEATRGAARQEMS